MKNAVNQKSTTALRLIKGSSKMKASFFTLLLIVLISASAFAKTVASESESKERVTTEIRKQLNAQIAFPEFIKSANIKSESVNVLFKVGKDGKVSVVRADGANENLNSYIQHELNNARIESVQGTEEQVYKININFKLL